MCCQRACVISYFGWLKISHGNKTAEIIRCELYIIYGTFFILEWLILGIPKAQSKISYNFYQFKQSSIFWLTSNRCFYFADLQKLIIGDYRPQFVLSNSITNMVIIVKQPGLNFIIYYSNEVIIPQKRMFKLV